MNQQIDPMISLEAMGITLPVPSAPAFSYSAVKRSGNHIYISGQVSADANGLIKGRLGETISLEDGINAAKQCGIMLLAQIVHAADTPLKDVVQIVKLLVMVNSTPDFEEHPKIANGASDLLVDVLGERGKHARSAFGVSALPFGAAVEVEAIIEV